MKTVRITFSGGFHNANEITVRAKKNQNGLSFSDYQIKKIDNHMCGIKHCLCRGIEWNIDSEDISREELNSALYESY